MKIIIPIDVDSNRSYPEEITIRRGVIREHNVVFEFDNDRQIEVNLEQLKKILGMI